jgi:hypothetical protein
VIRISGMFPVDHDHLMRRADERVDHVRADESGSTTDNDLQFLSPPLRRTVAVERNETGAAFMGENPRIKDFVIA